MRALTTIGKRRMRKLVKFGKAYMKDLVSEPQPPSDPHSPPHRDAGLLYQKVSGRTVQRGNRVTGTVSSTALKVGRPYPLFLEVGTEDMKPRPFLMPTLRAMQAEARTVMLGKFDGAEYDYLKTRDEMLKGLKKTLKQPRIVITI